MHNEKESMHFGVQMIIYLICLPFIFLLEIMSTFAMLQVALIYFSTTIIMYIASLAGITFKPFILDDAKRDFNTDYQGLGIKGLLFVIIAYALLLIIFILRIPFSASGIVYYAFIILYPIFMFKLEPRKDRQIEESINE